MRDEILVYEMRPATDDDRQVVHELLRARDDWARRHGLLPADSIALRVLIGNTGDDMALMLLTENNDAVGCVVLHATSPVWRWTFSERAEPSMSLATMYTHPDQRDAGLARLMTLWVLDYAARRTDLELQWVRCTVPDNRLACYFREELGWQEVRVTRDGLGRRYAKMQQRPRRLPQLSALISSDDPVLVASDPTVTTSPAIPPQPRQTPDSVTSEQGGGHS
ncbi:GNAT family N-acetyltransferase [Streptomyces sp. TP-A0356]|uniref:GNAT family N-acetyltransferase n=1 Tax=Streptomyces sp. TP-A0356 TaxID=1359208 RepID=UPI000AC69048|nr:GNAT family N-acetyltransferase [Streptomyces sp. TP-A0356]